VIIINKNFKNPTAFISIQQMWILFIFPGLVQNAETAKMDRMGFFILTPCLGALCDYLFESVDLEEA
jgi:hypothetical protein